MSFSLHPRIVFLLVFALCLALLAYGLVLQYVYGLEPCPLCVFQRIAYIVMLVISLIAVIHNPGNPARHFYNGALLIAAGAGAGIASRQVWLQHLPVDQVPECGPGLDYMLEVFPFFEALQMILSGSGECAEVKWQFLGMSIAEWSLVWFLFFILLIIFSIFNVKQSI